MSRVWGEADKAHQQNLIVKACLNTPGGEQSKRRSARHSALKKKRQERLEKRRRGFGFPAALWHSGVRPVYFLTQATCCVRTWSSGCLSSCEAPVWIQAIQSDSWVFYFISMHCLMCKQAFSTPFILQNSLNSRRRGSLGVNCLLITPTTLTSSRVGFSTYIITLWAVSRQAVHLIWI